MKFSSVSAQNGGDLEILHLIYLVSKLSISNTIQLKRKDFLFRSINDVIMSNNIKKETSVEVSKMYIAKKSPKNSFNTIA